MLMKAIAPAKGFRYAQKLRMPGDEFEMEARHVPAFEKLGHAERVAEQKVKPKKHGRAPD